MPCMHAHGHSTLSTVALRQKDALHRKDEVWESPPPLNFSAGCKAIMVATSCFASACNITCLLFIPEHALGCSTTCDDVCCVMNTVRSRGHVCPQGGKVHLLEFLVCSVVPIHIRLMVLAMM